MNNNRKIISFLKENSGLKQKEIAEKCGLTSSSITNLKNQKSINLSTLILLTDKLGAKIIIEFNDEKLIIN
jgi:transcriptional regulator with XRE-family HTH domain